MARVPEIESARRTFVMLAVLALLCALLAFGARPAQAETTFAVNSTADGADNDTTDSSCFTGNTRIILVGNILVRQNECTLRAAIEQANATSGADTINFGIPTNDSGYDSATGVWTITPASALPEITDPVTINGYTQMGASANTNGPDQGDNAALKIQLNGSNSSITNQDGTVTYYPVLRISAGASTVKGLVINRFKLTNSMSAISLTGTGGDVIEGNFLGTDPGGTKAWGCPSDANCMGGLIVNTSGTGNTIGGTTSAARNVIAGGGFQYGVLIESTGNVVQGNLVGMSAAGTNLLEGFDSRGHLGPVLGNSSGVGILGGSGNTIGGTTPAARNVISGNLSGVSISAGSALGTMDFGEPHDNSVQGNFIGGTVAGTSGLDNGRGVRISNAASNIIGGTEAGAGNVISSNAVRGVEIVSGNGDSVLSNSISTNEKLGIDLVGGTQDANGVTSNDLLDADAGANNLQNFPVLTSAIDSSGTVTVTGKLNSEADKTYNVQFFTSPSADPSGYGEGQIYLDQTSATTDASGNAGFSFTSSNAPTGKQVVTATATSPSGDTSEFSAAINVKPANDDYTDAQDISDSTASVNGTTADATRESGEPDHLPADDSSLGEHSVWYRWTSPATGKASIDTCTNTTDTVLAVYTGDSLNNLSHVADNDDGCASGTGSKVSLNAQAGTTYRIAVAGHDSSSEGTFTLDFSPLVTTVVPSEGATGVRRSSNVSATFSEEMDPKTLVMAPTDPANPNVGTSTTVTLIRTGTTTSVPGMVTVSEDGKTVTLDPSVSLAKRKTYTARISGVKDLAGNALPDKIWPFKTGRR